jgi:hypothetical protein
MNIYKLKHDKESAIADLIAKNVIEINRGINFILTELNLLVECGVITITQAT